jgi:hypothetical protein
MIHIHFIGLDSPFILNAYLTKNSMELNTRCVHLSFLSKHYVEAMLFLKKVF